MNHYAHGFISDDEVVLRHKLKDGVGLTIGDVDGPHLILTSGQARELAAGLNYLADVVTGLDIPARRVHR